MTEHSEHSGRYRWHDDDCLCRTAGIEFCNRNGNIWSCCGQTDEAAPCARAPWPPRPEKPWPHVAAPQTPTAPKVPAPVDPTRWVWTGRLPSGGRRRRYTFYIEDSEVRIPDMDHGRDDRLPVRREQETFLDGQTDLLESWGFCIWRTLEGPVSRVELERRLELAYPRSKRNPV